MELVEEANSVQRADQLQVLHLLQASLFHLPSRSGRITEHRGNAEVSQDLLKSNVPMKASPVLWRILPPPTVGFFAVGEAGRRKVGLRSTLISRAFHLLSFCGL